MRASTAAWLVAGVVSALLRGAPAAEGLRVGPVALAALVAPSAPLASQDLTFDARFADLAVRYLETPDPSLVDRLAGLPATAHLLRHARHFDYDVAKDSPGALVRDLLRADGASTESAATCRRSLAYFSETVLGDPGWVADVLRDLPAGFRFRGSSLYLTCGYDIGVALAPTASLNGAHRKFAQHPRELLYYAIHELHHVGFMTMHPPPRLADLKTCADVLRFVEYATQLEGMAVHAAAGRRAREHALADDGDYVALGDPAVMRDVEARYDAICAGLRRRGTQPADPDAMSAIERMSSERLWYRVGAHAAALIEERLGRPALAGLVAQGPAAFLERYRQLSGR